MPVRSLAFLIVALALLTGADARPLAAAPPVQASADTISAYRMSHGWFSRDKGYHLGVSAVGAAVLYGAGREIGLGRWPSAVAASLVMGTVGFLREAYDPEESDMISRKAFSRKDMAWNGAGIALGISLTDLIGSARWRTPETHERAIEPAPARRDDQ